MTAPVITLLLPGARLDQLIDQIRPGVAVGAFLPAAAAGARAASPARQTAALRP